MTLASTAIRDDVSIGHLLERSHNLLESRIHAEKTIENGKLREKVSNGNATGKEQMFYDFMMNGGETGLVSSLDVED